MLFGSDELKDLLLRASEDENLYETAMNELYDSVRFYAESKVKTGFAPNEVWHGSAPVSTETLGYHDCQDVVGEVLCRVIKSLNTFLDNLKDNNYTEAQRQAWLRTLIYFTLADYLRISRRITIPEDFEDILKRNDVVCGANYESVSDIIMEESLKNIIKAACSANSKPEKIFAYLFSVIIFREISCHDKNGNSQMTVNFMNGKSLYTLKKSFIKMVYLVYGVIVTENEIGPLTAVVGDESPSEAGSMICKVTEKSVADWTYRIKTHMFKYKDEIFGEGFKK